MFSCSLSRSPSARGFVGINNSPPASALSGSELSDGIEGVPVGARGSGNGLSSAASAGSAAGPASRCSGPAWGLRQGWARGAPREPTDTEGAVPLRQTPPLSRQLRCEGSCASAGGARSLELFSPRAAAVRMYLHACVCTCACAHVKAWTQCLHQPQPSEPQSPSGETGSRWLALPTSGPSSRTFSAQAALSLSHPPARGSPWVTSGMLQPRAGRGALSFPGSPVALVPAAAWSGIRVCV